MNQVSIELRRFAARRLVRGAFLFAVLLVVAAVSINTARGHEARAGNQAPAGNETPATTVGPGQAPVPGAGFAPVEGDSRIDIGANLGGALVGTGVALLLLGFVLGASFVGAEFNGGSLSTQLLFEPRRSRVHVAKAVGVGIGVGCFALAILAFVALSMYAGSELHGIVRGLDGSFWRARAGQALRISTAVAVGAAMAYTVAIVFRRTTASVIAFLIQFPIISLLERGTFHWVAHYAPVQALVTMMLNPDRFADPALRPIRTTAGAVALTCTWAAVLLLASGGVFSRTEVR